MVTSRITFKLTNFLRKVKENFWIDFRDVPEKAQDFYGFSLTDLEIEELNTYLRKNKVLRN